MPALPVPRDNTVVIGHKRPDLDSIAAAIGYSTLLSEENQSAIAARAGQTDDQTAWALARFGFDPPVALMDVAPTFAAVAEPAPPFPAESTIRDALLKLGTGARALPVIDPGGRPVALIDACLCVAVLGRLLARPGNDPRTPFDHALLCDGPERDIPPPVTFRFDERLADRRAAIARCDVDDYIVVDEHGRYLGVVSRAAALSPPRPRLVLVDHNELGQAVPGTDQAEIVEVIDHHKLGNPATTVPIPFVVDVVGSTATLVEERWRLRKGPPPPNLAGLLLSAILSDTLAFRSPTCTSRDTSAAARLAERARITDIDAFGDEVIMAGAGLGQRDPDEIVAEDSKDFTTSKGLVVVAQAEVRSLHEIAPRAADLNAALARLRDNRKAVLAALLLTDPVRATSRLMVNGDPRVVAVVPYARAADGIFDAPGIVSRKKQLVPALLAAIESG